MSLTSGILGLTAANFSSENVFVPEEDLQNGEAKFNSTTHPLAAEILSFRETNRALHKGANDLRDIIAASQPGGGTFTPYFNLTTLINPAQEFVIRFQRFANPPTPPPGCSCSHLCNHQVSCGCAAAGMAGPGDRFLLQRQMPGGVWTHSGHADISWITGDALGAADGETVTFRVCAVNKWGGRCGEPISFTYVNVGACFA